MNRTKKMRLEDRARLLKAMGHPSRILIIEELAAGERCVCDLTRMIGADISTVSRHLTVLRNAGIVAGDKRGNQVFYRLQLPCVLQFFSCLEAHGVLSSSS